MVSDSPGTTTEQCDELTSFLTSMQDTSSTQKDAHVSADETESDDALSDVSAASYESDVFHVETMAVESRQHLTEQDLDLQRIRNLVAHIRDRPLLPMDPRQPGQVFTDIDSGIALPLAHCAMICDDGQACTWADPGLDPLSNNEDYGHVASLRQHLLTYHNFIFRDALGPEVPMKQYMDYYEEACKEKERQRVPLVGLSVDRRTLRHLQEVLQPKSVQCLMCFVCSEKHLCIRDMDRDGRIVNKGDIAYHTIGAFNEHACQDTADRKFTENLDFKTYCDRYASKSKLSLIHI